MWGGLLDRPGYGTGTGIGGLDPRARGYGAAARTAAAPGARQAGNPYAAQPPTGGPAAPQTANMLVGLVLVELLALVMLRRLFRNYHGG